MNLPTVARLLIVPLMVAHFRASTAAAQTTPPIPANALRANMVERAENWQWSSLSRRKRKRATPPMTAWPVDRSDAWIAIVNEPQSEAAQSNVRVSLDRQRPFGQSTWATRISKKLGLEASLTPRGRRTQT